MRARSTQKWQFVHVAIAKSAITGPVTKEFDQADFFVIADGFGATSARLATSEMFIGTRSGGRGMQDGGQLYWHRLTGRSLHPSQAQCVAQHKDT